MQVLYAYYMQSNTGDNEGLEMKLHSGDDGSISEFCSPTIKLSFTLRSSCQAADGKTFGTIVLAVTSYSDPGRTLDT